MGVWHFMSLGRSPGAVTSALAYIKRRFEQNDIDFFGSDSERHNVKKTSGIVIFTTQEVRYGRLKARENESYVNNSYGLDKGKESPLGNTDGYINTFEIVLRFITDQLGEMLREERGKIYWLEASYHDLNFNLHQLSRAFYVLSPPGKTGREVWVNLTGGSNIMNLATLLITVMSGITGRAYYTYTQDIRLLQPASEDNFWYDVPVLKLNFDRNYEAILRVLDSHDDWMDSERLFSEVKRQIQLPSDKNSFVRDYLNKLDGWLIERHGNRNRLLKPAGKRFLNLMDDDLMRALIYKEPLGNPPLISEVFQEVFS